MNTIHAVFSLCEALYADPSPVDPIESLPLIDILIIVAVLFGTVGIVISFRIFYRKWKRNIYRRTPSDLLPNRKKNLTDYDKRMLVDKINDSRRGNLKKTFVSTVSSKGMIFATVGLILLSLLFVIGMILLKFQKH